MEGAQDLAMNYPEHKEVICHESLYRPLFAK